MALEWIPEHPGVSLNDLQNDIKNLADSIDWKGTVNFISQYHPHAAFAIQQLAQNKTYALSNKDYPTTTWSLDGPWTFAAPITEGPFYRPFNKNILPKDYFHIYIEDFDTRPGNLVYDWRLGIPALLQMISWRIQYIAAMYPEFRTTYERSFEFNWYRDALVRHYNRMMNGVKCGAHGDGDIYLYVCGDIYSGQRHYAAVRSDKDHVYVSYDYDAGRGRDGNYWTVYDSRKPKQHDDPGVYDSAGRAVGSWYIYEELASIAKRNLPLFEMKAMINTLTLYTHYSMDLTEQFQRIQPYHNTHLCLDAPDWASPAKMSSSRIAMKQTARNGFMTERAVR